MFIVSIIKVIKNPIMIPKTQSNTIRNIYESIRTTSQKMFKISKKYVKIITLYFVLIIMFILVQT